MFTCSGMLWDDLSAPCVCFWPTSLYTCSTKHLDNWQLWPWLLKSTAVVLNLFRFPWTGCGISLCKTNSMLLWPSNACLSEKWRELSSERLSFAQHSQKGFQKDGDVFSSMKEIVVFLSHEVNCSITTLLSRIAPVSLVLHYFPRRADEPTNEQWRNQY